MAGVPCIQWIVVAVLCTLLYCVSSQEARNCNVANKDGLPSDVCTYDLRMKGALPKKNDQYFCAGYNVASEVLGEGNNPLAEGYIVKYEALADANTAHHILVFGCESLRSGVGDMWHCGQVCDRGEQIVFAWAKNAPPLTLPNGVGQHIGGLTTKIKHIVIQIHYVNPLQAPDNSGIRMYITKQRQPFISGIYLLLSYGVTIPANTPKFHVDASCVFNWGDSIIPFGYRTHAHTLGTVISGYKVDRMGSAQLVGKGNPQWPQAFYPVKEQFKIRPGDLLAARCTYNSTGRFRTTEIGSTSNDEMCNFYIMYYMNSTMEYRRGEDTCTRNQARQVFQFLPPDNDTPLPSNPALEEVAHGHHHGMGDGHGSNVGTTAGSFIDEPKVDVEKPLVDISPTQNGMTNQLVQTGYKSQGNKPISTSMRTSLLDNSYRSMPAGYNNVQKSPQYFLDYPGLNDYYDVLQERSRNRLKKPFYDLYDNPLLDYSDLSKRPLSSLSRNRNKVFNDKYEEYAAGDLTKSSPLDRGRVSTKYDTQSRTKVAMVTKSDSQSEAALQSPGRTSKVLNLKPELGMTFLSAVPNIEIGQVGGLAVGGNGDLYIFHRGSNIWDSWSFNGNNVYTNQNKPIVMDTVVILNKDGEVLRHFGSNSYFLPHGISLDSKENIWLTDVALHQVFRIPKGGTRPDRTWGVRFEPGTDNNHFCKPSDVAVLTTGEFFVSDGYCNSRIMKFNKDGEFIKQWGTSSMAQSGNKFPPPGTFNLPHSVTVAEDKQLVCVADRENGRIQCFDYDGNFVRQMAPKLFGAALYAVEYCPNHGGLLFAVNGPVYGKDPVDTQGFTLDINTGDVVSVWNIPGSTLTHPHDVAVDSVDHFVYVGELNPRKVWKFQMSQALYSASPSANTSSVNKQPGVVTDKPAPPTEVTKGVSKETSMINVVKVTVPHSNNVVNVMYTSGATSTPFTTVESATIASTITVVKPVLSSPASVNPITDNKPYATARPIPVTVVNPVPSTAGTLSTEPTTARSSEAPTAVEHVQPTTTPYKLPIVTFVNPGQPRPHYKDPTTLMTHKLSTARPIAASTATPSASPTTGGTAVPTAQSTTINIEHPSTTTSTVPSVNPSQPGQINKESSVVDNKKPTVIDISKAKPVYVENGKTSQVTVEIITTEESDGMGPSVIIGTLLVVPVLLLIIITVTIRLYKNGHFRNCRSRSSKKSVFSLGNFLHSHRGFDRLSTEDDDHDFDNALDDSDNEEFNITRKA